MARLFFQIVALMALTFSLAFAEDPVPTEIGKVDWQRNYDAAKKSAAESGKPMLVFFQEVPGWQTCVDFGRGPMTNPLLVEAAEDLFVPVLIYNNKPGQDAKLLKYFREPSWNNPVIRYLSASEKDLTPRKELVLSVAETASRMAGSLEKANGAPPAWLNALAVPMKEKQLEWATFSMYWFWEGEAQLGSLDGVYATAAKWRDGLEVVSVLYDPKEINYQTLLNAAKKFKCTDKVFTHTQQQMNVAKKLVGNKAVMVSDSQSSRFAKLSDQKYYLANSPLRSLPMCDYQITKLNAALGMKQPYESLLSPRQKVLAKKILKAHKSDNKALDGLITPIDGNKLGQYAEKLKAALADAGQTVSDWHDERVCKPARFDISNRSETLKSTTCGIGGPFE